MPTRLGLQATTTAVLVVDMQNDDLHPEGAFASTGAADHAASQDVVRNVRAVLDAARARRPRSSGDVAQVGGRRRPSSRRTDRQRWEPTGQAGARVASMCARRPDGRS